MLHPKRSPRKVNAIKLAGATSAQISQYDYRYDANGNRIEQVLNQGHQTETTTYEYDPNDRLTAVHYPD